MRVDAVELYEVQLPLVAPFRTSFGTEWVKHALLVRLITDVTEGWGECVAGPQPLYSSEYVAGAADVIRTFLAPTLLAQQAVAALDVARLLRPVKGHRMAKAALEMAVLDAELRHREVSLGRYLGAVVDQVPSGVSVGIMDSIPELIDRVAGYLDEGYVRIKLKIEPGWDVDVVRAVRERFGDIALQVDANAAYSLVDAPLLARLDAFDLLLIEQPLGEEDLRQHAELATRIRTPVCLDESIVSAASAADALVLGACSVINIKPGRVGGYLEAKKIHDLAMAHGAAVWCGGMLETGLGRAANISLAALPGFTLPGDVSGSSRFYAEDITEPILMSGGVVHVPTGPGIGIAPLPGALQQFGLSTELLTRG